MTNKALSEEIWEFISEQQQNNSEHDILAQEYGIKEHTNLLVSHFIRIY